MITAFFGSYIGKLILTAGMAMLPVVELRGAIPFGVSLGLSTQTAFFASVIGNMIPVPFIVVLIRSIFERLRSHPRFGGMIEKLERRAHLKGRLVTKYRLAGLCLLVAIPLPGTGAWTGALIAGLLGMRLRQSLPAITVGVIIAGVVVSMATEGLISAFGL